MAGQDRQNRIAKTGRPAKDSQDRTARGQPGQNRRATTAKTEHDI
jgi:hypothetical protein